MKITSFISICNKRGELWVYRSEFMSSWAKHITLTVPANLHAGGVVILPVASCYRDHDKCS